MSCIFLAKIDVSALYSVLLNVISSVYSKILACMDLYIFRCILVSFFSETRRMRGVVNRASWWSRSIRRYKFKFCLPAAWRCSPWCQPSTSLLLLVAIMSTLQLEGGHVLMLIQVSDTYAKNCCSGAVVLCCLRVCLHGGRVNLLEGSIDSPRLHV